MTDYGHELQFGIFPSPDAATVRQTLELAQLADVAGLDLVTVQDHPYQAKHLDAWTLLSVIAARTSSARVALNVSNLPLPPPPVVLARSVATLDRLSGGRTELGLGTGAFWDAIVAAGGERRAPKDAVDALVEAIRVIRGVWGTGSVTVLGQHYHVNGLHAGPTPAHDIGIWLGAYRPRMLRVTGQLADGWIPSLGYADPPALAAMNAQLDEAAVAAGRAPGSIRRIYNIFGRFGSGSGFLQGAPADWAEQLAELALEAGMSSYLLGTDAADDVRRFAEEVAPSVRELVDRERGRAIPALRREDREPLVVPAATPTTTAPPLAVSPTPDDGTRLSAELPWDESTRPVTEKPSAAAYSLQQQAQPQHLVDVHDALRAELAQLRDVVEQVRRGHLTVGAARSVINTMTMRQNNWTLGAYCQSYCRIVTGHHTLEDRSIFRHLRHADPRLGAVLDRLEQVQQSIDLLTDTLLSHLAYEERELLHPLARYGLT